MSNYDITTKSRESLDFVSGLWYVNSMFRKQAAHPEQLRARLELRRSNASVPHVNKKKYTRKKKHKNEEVD